FNGGVTAKPASWTTSSTTGFEIDNLKVTVPQGASAGDVVVQVADRKSNALKLIKIDNNSCSLEEGKTFGSTYGYLPTKYNPCGEGEEQQWDLPLCYKLGPRGTIIPEPTKCDMAEYNLVQESLTGSWSCNSIDLVFTSTVTTRNNASLTFTGTANIKADVTSGKLTKTTSGSVHQVWGTKVCDKPFTTR
ncbi:MAG: hypothetical protein HQK67_11560, partial [Desulfamplus sp.]|nr:hypothetical protein [Desulfamplus sp.]